MNKIQLSSGKVHQSIELKDKLPSLSIVMPCFNESKQIIISWDEIFHTYNSLILKKIISKDSIIIFIDDGSSDSTWEEISKICNKFNIVKGFRFIKNYGHQIALLAGMELSNSFNKDICVTIDSDMQQDPSAIELMVANFMSGSEVVYGVRLDRNTDGFFKKFTAFVFNLSLKLLNINYINGHSDYRLLSSRVITHLSENISSDNIFLRTQIPSLGYPYAIVPHSVKIRHVGETKYTLKKMISLALRAFISSTTKPIAYIIYIGITAMLISIILFIYAMTIKYLSYPASGWASLVMLISFYCGLILLGQGIIANYLLSRGKSKSINLYVIIEAKNI
jgi:glycosyltransferase involved in cell wall biosynthesis